MPTDCILVTGGAGYIGSHTVVELVKHGYDVVVVDSLINSSYEAIARIEYIVKKSLPFYQVDVRDREGLSRVFKKHKISSVIHFAALKAVGESTKLPLNYYENNVGGTLNLLRVMNDFEVKCIVFSSSATVYGDATRFENMIPIPENCPTDPTNPYGRTKLTIENILKDVYSSDSNWKCAILRYFNPIGAHPSGLIGEDPLGIPNNLLPYLAQVAIGRREKLSIFGSDYNSHDGTPIRDYIHVVDLAMGHIAALNYLNNVDTKGILREWNLGTGNGSTVFDIYHAFCKSIGRKLPYQVIGRRAGDVLDLTADPRRANKELSWKAKYTIEDSCRDLWRWTEDNPYGYHIENYKWQSFDGCNDRLHIVELGDLKISIANRGALIQNVVYKGKSLINHFDNIGDYKDPSNPYIGTTIGRYANRIVGGKFELNGTVFETTLNEGVCTLHGGLNGFDKQNFLGPVVQSSQNHVVLSFLLVDHHLNNGFPGDLETIVRYEITPQSLSVELEAKLVGKSDSTPVNLTNHTYFNLTGRSTIDGTWVKSITNSCLDVDPIRGTPRDNLITSPYNLEKGIILSSTEIFDNCFVVDPDLDKIDTRKEPLREIFQAFHQDSGIYVSLFSTEPAFQFYTGDFTKTAKYGSRSGFCVEPSRIANAVNVEKYKSTVVLNKSDTFGSLTKIFFGSRK